MLGVDGETRKGSKVPGNRGKEGASSAPRRWKPVSMGIEDPETGRAEEPGPLLSAQPCCPLPSPRATSCPSSLPYLTQAKPCLLNSRTHSERQTNFRH